MRPDILSTIKKLSKDTYQSAVSHDISLHGAAIAFYTIFSIAPLIIIILGLTAIFLGEQQSITLFSRYLEELLGASIARSLLSFAQDTHRQTSGIIATIVATLILLYGATKMLTQLKKTLNTVWSVSNPAMSSVKAYLFNRAIALTTIFLLTGLFIASLVLEGGINFFSGLFLPYVPDVFIPFLKLISSFLSILMTVLFFTLLFKILPDIRARWKDIIVGGCVTTILFLIGKYAIGFYLASDMLQAGYKAAGSFVIFLIWIYYNVQIVLIGAEFTQVYTKEYGKKLRPARRAKFIEADESA